MIETFYNYLIAAFYPITDILSVAAFIYVVRSCYSLLKWLFSKFNILGGKKR